MFNRHVTVIALGAALMAALGASAQTSLRTATWDNNNLTFSHAFTLPGVAMPAGTYVFESGPKGTNANIVRVSSKNGQTIFYQGFTTLIAHPAGRSGAAFGEAAPGVPPPMVAWYPVGSELAYKFTYRP
jgi:hypothetical protein